MPVAVPTLDASLDPTTAYRRQARRLRGRHANDPCKLHRALAELNARPPTDVAFVSPQERSSGLFGSASHERKNPERHSWGETVRVSPTLRAKPTPVIACPAWLLGLPPDRERAVRRFVDHARAAIATDAILTFGRRARLLSEGERLGVDRFHANLVLAALTHEARVASDADVTSIASEGKRWLAVLATQTAIIVAGIAMLKSIL